MTLALIVAAAENDVIGRQGTIPWHLPEDLRHFKQVTTGHALIMGRATYDSIVANLGYPLRDRLSIVVSRTRRISTHKNVVYLPDLDQALAVAEDYARHWNSNIFIAGGAQVYGQLLHRAAYIHLTRVHASVAGDVRMPPKWLDGFEVARERTISGGPGPSYSFCEYRRVQT